MLDELTKICKRCGKEFGYVPGHVFCIGSDLYCGHNCRTYELREREEAKRKREEEALERKRLRQKKRNIERYRFDKNNMEPYSAEKIPGQCRAVLKCRADNGEVVARFASLKAAAAAAGIAPGTMSQRINGKSKQKQEFVWKFEEGR